VDFGLPLFSFLAGRGLLQSPESMVSCVHDLELPLRCRQWCRTDKFRVHNEFYENRPGGRQFSTWQPGNRVGKCWWSMKLRCSRKGVPRVDLRTKSALRLYKMHLFCRRDYSVFRKTCRSRIEWFLLMFSQKTKRPPAISGR
jgi:hypothetical protein